MITIQPFPTKCEFICLKWKNTEWTFGDKKSFGFLYRPEKVRTKDKKERNETIEFFIGTSYYRFFLDYTRAIATKEECNVFP
jgi:hypothetical protein